MQTSQRFKSTDILVFSPPPLSHGRSETICFPCIWFHVSLPVCASLLVFFPSHSTLFPPGVNSEMSTFSCASDCHWISERKRKWSALLVLFSSPLSSAWIFVCLSSFLSCYFYRSLSFRLFFCSPLSFFCPLLRLFLSLYNAQLH